MTQIRINKTKELAQTLDNLKQNEFPLLEEAEIVKVLLSIGINQTKKDSFLRRLWEEVKQTGKKSGDDFLANNGFKKEDLSEDQLYELIAKL